MLEKLEQKIGKITGAWALHPTGFHNVEDIIYLRENGTVSSSSGIKMWAASGPYLLLIDDKLIVRFIFRYSQSQENAIVLENLQAGKAPKYFLRSCGETHSLTACYEGMRKAEDIDFVGTLNSRVDFSAEIEPGSNIFVPLEQDLTIDHFADDHLKYNFNTPDYRIALNPQPVTLPPVYAAVINNAKMISGVVVETADGRCLRESVSNSDTSTHNSAINCYTDYKKEVELYPNVEVRDRIEGLSIYVENGYGIDHWLMQSLPTIYVLDWLEKTGVNMSKVNLLLRSGFACDEHKEAYRAAGVFDKIRESSCIDLSKLSPAIKVDQLIFPSFMWLITWENRPSNYHFSLYALSQKTKPVFDRIKQNLLQVAPVKKYPPLIFLMRRAKTARKRLLNEDALFEALKPLGFTAIDPAELDMASKIATFRHARVIVGARGGGFTFTLFCQPGTHVHMLCHKTQAFDFDHPKVIAAMTGAKFSCAIYPQTFRPDDAEYLFNLGCFEADIDEVMTNIKKMLTRPELADLKDSNAAAA